MVELSEASLREVADELRGRARRTCQGCEGWWGDWPGSGGGTAIIAAPFCARCLGTGLEAWTELLALAERLEALFDD